MNVNELVRECFHMWTTIYVASGLEWAKEIEKKLNQEGFLIRIKFFAQEGDEELYEILAPKFEAQDIQSALIELGLF